MALKGLKKATGVLTNAGVTYGPFEFDTFTGRKRTRASKKKRKGAGGIRRVRAGQDDVENATATLENDGTLDQELIWDKSRNGTWTVTEVPVDGDGNPRAKGTRTYTGKLVGLEEGEVDIENDEDIDMLTLDFAFDSVVS